MIDTYTYTWKSGANEEYATKAFFLTQQGTKELMKNTPTSGNKNSFGKVMFPRGSFENMGFFFISFFLTTLSTFYDLWYSPPREE